MGKVKVIYSDNREIEGNALFFNLKKPSFPLQIETHEGKVEVQHVFFNNVKKILFLKPEPGAESAIRTENISQSKFASSVTFRLSVEFLDGEVLTGSTMRYKRSDPGFFLIPLNPADKSERIYINAREVKHVDQFQLLGKILMNQKKITENQLDHALKQQSEIRNKKIGTILLEEEIINKKQLDDSLEKQRIIPKLLGEILIEAGYITKEQLVRALQIQHENRGKRLGQILVELKYLTPNDICIALSSQLNYPWIDLSSVDIPSEIATLLPREFVLKHEVIPVELRGNGVMVIASTMPNNSVLQKEISQFVSCKMELVIAYDGDLISAIHRYYPTRE
ncbi:MAG: hypothetical protein JXB26_16770 [Candidatus Aminicenantes bacterium]|nr:hypothetical protein [Candidatus Aminicenantes bacterium]